MINKTSIIKLIVLVILLPLAHVAQPICDYNPDFGTIRLWMHFDPDHNLYLDHLYTSPDESFDMEIIDPRLRA